MSSLTYKQARREILSKFKTAWDTTSYEAFYDDVKKQRSSSSSPWAVVTLRHTAGRQSTLSSDVGNRRFSRTGTLTVQIFTSAGKGLQESYDLAKVVSDAFEGSYTPGGVWFRNLTLREVGRDGEFFQVNVITEFTYDEIK